MIKKIWIILFFVAVVGAWHAVPLQGLPLLSGTAFALLQDDGQPCPPECITDSMEIVTWYPSPYNEYEELRLYPVQRDSSYCTDDKKGLMYYDDNNTPMDASDDKVRVCMGSSTWTGGGWQTAGHWEYISGTTDIKPSNSGVVKIQNLKIDQTTQDGYVLTSDANGNASWKVASSGETFSNIWEKNSPGTYSWPVPSGVNMIMVEVWGGGGGGGAGTTSTQEGGNNGGNGGQSSFRSGGSVLASSSGGNGGAASGLGNCGSTCGTGGNGGQSGIIVNASVMDLENIAGNNGDGGSIGCSQDVSGAIGGVGYDGAGSGGNGGNGVKTVNACCIGICSGAGGGGGGYRKVELKVISGTVYTLVVGAGGNGGTGPTNGASGGNGKVKIHY